MKAWLDAALIKCPNCGHYYLDASWYVIEMDSDIQCGQCGKEFNSKKNAKDRIMLEFQINKDQRICKNKNSRTPKNRRITEVLPQVFMFKF